MNPYFEQAGIWRGVHGLLLGQLTFVLTPQVSPRSFVEYEESLFIDENQMLEKQQLFAVADLAVSEPKSKRRPVRGGGGTALLEAPPAPFTATLPMHIQGKHHWLTIRDSKTRKIITVIEVLSPTNKRPGADRERYLAKRRRILGSKAHLVEIDLLRGGTRMPLGNAPPPSDYLLLVSRRKERPQVGLWPFGLRDPIPMFPLPLGPGEPEPMIDLRPVLDHVYDGAAYRYRLYDDQPDPPLSPEDAAWAAGLITPAVRVTSE